MLISHKSAFSEIKLLLFAKYYANIYFVTLLLASK